MTLPIGTKKRKIAEFYNEELQRIRNISLPPLVDGASYAEYTIRVDNRDLIVKKLQKQGIQTNTLFSYSVPYLTSFKDYTTEEFTNSLVASRYVINLPSYPSLFDKPEKLHYIVNSVIECVKQSVSNLEGAAKCLQSFPFSKL